MARTATSAAMARSDAERQRGKRRRDRHNLLQYRVDVLASALDLLIDAGKMTEAEAADPAAVARRIALGFYVNVEQETGKRVTL